MVLELKVVLSHLEDKKETREKEEFVVDLEELKSQLEASSSALVPIGNKKDCTQKKFCLKKLFCVIQSSFVYLF